MAQLALYMEEVLEISDDVFQNDLGIHPPQHKTRREVDVFVKALDEKGKVIKNKKEEVAKNVEANGRDEVQLRILEKLDEISASIVQLNTSHVALRNEISELRTHVDTSNSELRNEISELRTHVDTSNSELRNEISELRNEFRVSFASLSSSHNTITFLVIVHENQRRREVRIPQIPLPILRPEFISENNQLRQLLSVEEINGLEVEELRLYLNAYNVANDTTVDRRMLKILLRDVMGFISSYELSYLMI